MKIALIGYRAMGRLIETPAKERVMRSFLTDEADAALLPKRGRNI